MMFRKWLIIIGLLLVGTNVAFAQNIEVTAPNMVYLAADASGVQQVYQQTSADSEARQITHTVKDVLTFGAAYDGLSVAYISDGQLWLQPIHTDEAEALVPVSATQFSRTPVFSQDGQYIAYADKGLWLLDLGTRKTRELLTDVVVKADGSNTADARTYQPEQFVLGAEGKASKIIADVGVWEWNTVGVYALATDTFQLLEGQTHTDLLPLSDGRALVYGNSGLGGEAGLHLADSLDAINQSTEVLTFSSVTQETLFAQQAVELESGIVRVFGEALSTSSNEAKFFYLDYNVTTKTAAQPHIVTVANSSGGTVVAGQRSPDGTLMPIYQDAQFTAAGSPYGIFSLIDLSKNDAVTALDGTIGLFRWQE